MADIEPLLIVSNRFYIRQMSLDGRRMQLLERDLSNAVALDFYWDWEGGAQESLVFWSDVTSSGSTISSRKLISGDKTVSVLGLMICLRTYLQ